MIEKIIREHLIPPEEYIFGFADLRGLLSDKFNGFEYGISIGQRLKDAIVDKIADGPTAEYYLHYRKINENLAKLTKDISDALNINNIETLRIEPTVSTAELDTIYFKSLRTDLSHKMVATRSGLGWIGKTDLFISKKFGPRVRLVSILLRTKVMPKSSPLNSSRCGICNLCVDSCPARAANGKIWDINVAREEFFDPWKCRNQCAEFGTSRLQSDVRVCGMCISVCPVGKKNINPIRLSN